MSLHSVLFFYEATIIIVQNNANNQNLFDYKAVFIFFKRIYK